MSYNGSGTFLINSAGQPVVANTVISATVFNALTADLATGLSTAITKDGQTTVTANIPFGNNKITTLGAGTAATDAANLGQVQSTAAKLITVTGTDTITGSMSPQLTAYAAGQLLYFIANAANTGAVTINVDGLGAKAITRDGSTALAAGDINSGEVVVIVYDGTRFQMINAANSFGNTTINGTLTVTGNTGLQANVSITSALSVGGTFNVTGAATLGSTLSVTGKSDLPTVSTASINAAVALITTGTVTNLTATGASIASANIGNLQFTAASIASINAGVAVVTNLTATSASIASANVGTAVITTGTVTNLTSTSASIASANAAVALVTTGTVTNLTSTSASIASANLGTAVVTGLTVTGASIASVNVGAAVLSGNLTLSGGTANGVLYLNASKAATSGSALTFDGTNLSNTRSVATAYSGTNSATWTNGLVLTNTATPATGVANLIGFQGAGNTNNVFGVAQNASGNGDFVWATYTSTFSEVARLTASGNFGIGTASPATRLEVVGASAGSTVATFTSNETGSTTSLAVFQRSGGAVAAAVKYNASNSPLTIDFGTTTNHGLTFLTNNTERMRIDGSSGNVGIGTTSPAALLHADKTGITDGSSAEVARFQGTVSGGATNTNLRISSSVSAGSAASRYVSLGVFDHASASRDLVLQPSGGNLGIGTTSPTQRLEIKTDTDKITQFMSGSGTAVQWQTINDAKTANVPLAISTSETYFLTGGTERGRFTAGGYFKASSTGTYSNSTSSYHELRSSGSNDWIAYFQQTAATGPNGVVIEYTAAAPNGTGNTFLYCQDNAAVRATIRSNGGLANYQTNNVDLSDARTKNSITPAASMWSKIGALEIVTYKYNDQTHDDVNLGVIAQQVESVEAAWVDNDGFGETPEGEEPLKTVYTKDIYFAAIKALQEAMARIEKLEAEVAAMKGVA